MGGARASFSGSRYELITDNLLLANLDAAGWSEKRELDARTPTDSAFKLASNSGGSIDIFYKRGLYQYFFVPRGVNYQDYFSARLEPDTAIYSETANTLTIIEKKQQSKGGSVAEKLQTCHFKRKYYETLCSEIDVEVDLVWVLGEYFKKNKDSLLSVFNYMNENGSRYFFDSVPVSELRLV